MDVVADTDILSTFLKVKKPRLLQRLFPKSNILICPSVNLEIRKGMELGILGYSLMTRSTRFVAIKLGTAEQEVARGFREDTSLGSGDAECLAVARNRRCLLLTNDRNVERTADSLSIEHLNLPLLLRELWRSDLMTKSRVAKLVEEIEQKDNLVFKGKELIFR